MEALTRGAKMRKSGAGKAVCEPFLPALRKTLTTENDAEQGFSSPAVGSVSSANPSAGGGLPSVGPSGMAAVISGMALRLL